MIHEIGVQLQAALQAKGCPFVVIDGPERRPTTTFARERVVIERDMSAGDTFAATHLPGKNPVTRLTRLIGCKITIYARAPSKGALEFEHFRRAEQVLDVVLIALYGIAKGRQNQVAFTSGKFVEPPDLTEGETMGGAVYELHFTFDRGVADRTWAGAAQPTANVASGTIQSTTNVSGIVEGGGSESETACGNGGT